MAHRSKERREGGVLKGSFRAEEGIHHGTDKLCCILHPRFVFYSLVNVLPGFTLLWLLRQHKGIVQHESSV